MVRKRNELPCNPFNPYLQIAIMPKVVATAAEMFNVQRTVACLSLALEKMTMEFNTMDAVISARIKNLKVFLNSGFFIDDR
jgi:hypothetical protein